MARLINHSTTQVRQDQLETVHIHIGEQYLLDIAWVINAIHLLNRQKSQNPAIDNSIN